MHVMLGTDGNLGIWRYHVCNYDKYATCAIAIENNCHSRLLLVCLTTLDKGQRRWCFSGDAHEFLEFCVASKCGVERLL